MTDTDRQTLERVSHRLAQTFDVPLERATWYVNELVTTLGWTWTPTDVELALEYYLHPPWPVPFLFRRAHVERIERRNHEDTFALFQRLTKEPSSPRRDALLRELGFGREPATPLPPQEM
jgi:hypothetical protein